MNKKDKDEILEMFSKAFHEVVPPLLEDMEERLASKEDIDRLERKLNAQDNRSDRHGKQLENLENRVHVLEIASS